MKGYGTKLLVSLVLLIICNISTYAQWQLQESGTKARLRGISAVNAQVAWASGTGGTYCRTTDGGKHWQMGVIPEAATLDFRDVYAVDSRTAYLMSAGNGTASRIYKTTNGGQSWQEQFKGDDPQIFLDSIAFWDAKNGIAVSDPVAGRFLLLITIDGGQHWRPLTTGPMAKEGEAAFAASGTCLTISGKKDLWLVTGGTVARVWHSFDRGQNWQVAETPIVRGSDSTGIFSIAMRNAQQGIIVGGNYKVPEDDKANVAITNDGGQHWLTTQTCPRGYRSCVAYLPNRPNIVVSVGVGGSDYSKDGGRTWQLLDNMGFHSLSFAKNGSAGWAVGDDGRIAKLVLPF